MESPLTSSSCTSAEEIFRPRSRTSPRVSNRDGDANLVLGGAFSSSQTIDMLRRNPATKVGFGHGAYAAFLLDRDRVRTFRAHSTQPT